jgi:carboxyl-terminal processing protease
MVSGISGHLLDTAISLGTMHGRGATIRFVANPRRVDRAGTRVGTFTGPVAILVDGFTGSTSEFFAAGMQAVGRARVFGETSAGQSLPALMTRLPDGDVLMHAIADHEDAAGRRVEGIGVIPDERVPLSRVDLRNGRDAPLEAARAWIAAQHP